MYSSFLELSIGRAFPFAWIIDIRTFSLSDTTTRDSAQRKPAGRGSQNPRLPKFPFVGTTYVVRVIVRESEMTRRALSTVPSKGEPTWVGRETRITRPGSDHYIIYYVSFEFEKLIFVSKFKLLGSEFVQWEILGQSGTPIHRRTINH